MQATIVGTRLAGEHTVYQIRTDTTAGLSPTAERRCADFGALRLGLLDGVLGGASPGLWQSTFTRIGQAFGGSVQGTLESLALGSGSRLPPLPSLLVFGASKNSAATVAERTTAFQAFLRAACADPVISINPALRGFLALDGAPGLTDGGGGARRPAQSRSPALEQLVAMGFSGK